MPRRSTFPRTTTSDESAVESDPLLESGYASTAPRPLSPEERAEAEQRGRRLSAELAAALAALPDECRTIRGMAAYLQINANICQRAVAASQLQQQPLEAIARAPGVSGLRSLVKAMEARRMRPPLMKALGAAVEQFAVFLRECGGGSLAQMQRRIVVTGEDEVHQQADADERAEELTRQRMFQSTAAWFGARIRTWSTISLVRAHPQRPQYIQGGLLNAYIGHRARASAPPLLLGSYSHVDPSSADSPTPARRLAVEQLEATEAVFVPEFSTCPAPILSTRTSDLHSLQIIDTSAAAAGPVDTVLMTRFPDAMHPALYPVPFFSLYVLVAQPTQELIFDVWMERSLAAASIPSGKIGFAGRALREGEGLPWYHRLPGTASLELLSPEAIKPTDAWPRHVAATKYLFNKLGWEIGEFVGYRMRVVYPVWNTAAVMQFDFSPVDALSAMVSGTGAGRRRACAAWSGACFEIDAQQRGGARSLDAPVRLPQRLGERGAERSSEEVDPA